MLVKAVFRVNLQFGNARSYEQAVKTFNHKVENLFKGDVCIKPEVVFDDVNLALSIPNLNVMTLEKTIKNTAYLLESLAQFAMAGKGFCWILESGLATFTLVIEPKEEKTVIQHFLKGRQYAKEAGHEDLAIKELSAAINKFDRHWTALERRGYIYSLVGKYDEAIKDFDSSLAIYEHQADAYFSKARTLMMLKNYEQAIANFDSTWKNANPQMPIYWSARRMMAMSFLELGKNAEAATQLKMFLTIQKFTDENPNQAWIKSAWLTYSYALAKNNQERDAKEAFMKSIAATEGIEPILEGDILDHYNKMILICGVKNNTKNDKKIVEV